MNRRNFLAAGLALPAAGLVSRADAAQGKVDYRVLGKTGLKVSTVGFGCMITADPTVISRAVDMGINYFDTARNYQGGQNERMVGAALGARRKDIILASKSNDNPTSGTEILAEIETSLKELGTDHLDVWHLHGMGAPATITDELVGAMQKAKQQGKIRFMGLSCHGGLPGIVDRIIEAKLDVVQPQFSFAQAASWSPAVDKLSQAGVGVVAMKVMAKAGGRNAKPRPATFAPAALKWVIKNPSISTTVPSMTDIDQLEQNFAVMAQPFGDADQQILSARLEEITPYYCRTCGECTGQCPKGLPVSDMVRFAMYADGYGQFPLGRERFQRMAAEHQAVRCGDCENCVVKCPNGVHVAKQLMRAQELYG